MGRQASHGRGLAFWVPVAAGNIFFFGFVLALLFPSLKEALVPIVAGAGIVIMVLALPIFTLVGLISLFSKNRDSE